MQSAHTHSEQHLSTRRPRVQCRPAYSAFQLPPQHKQHTGQPAAGWGLVFAGRQCCQAAATASHTLCTLTCHCGLRRWPFADTTALWSHTWGLRLAQDPSTRFHARMLRCCHSNEPHRCAINPLCCSTHGDTLCMAVWLVVRTHVCMGAQCTHVILPSWGNNRWLLDTANWRVCAHCKNTHAAPSTSTSFTHTEPPSQKRPAGSVPNTTQPPGQRRARPGHYNI